SAAEPTQDPGVDCRADWSQADSQNAHASDLSALEVHAWAGILRRQRSPAPWAGTAGPARLGRTVGRHGSTARWDRTASSWNSSAAPRAGPAAPLAWTQPQRARLVP